MGREALSGSPGQNGALGKEIGRRQCTLGRYMRECQGARAGLGGHPARVTRRGVSGDVDPVTMDIESADLMDEEVGATRDLGKGRGRPGVTAIDDASSRNVKDRSRRTAARRQVVHGRERQGKPGRQRDALAV